MCSADLPVFEGTKAERRRKTRRNVVQEQYWRELRIEAAIIKTIYDPKQQLTEKELHRISSGLYDSMGADTAYTMNKHKRWEITPYSFVEDTKNPDANVIVLERKGTYKCQIYYTRQTEKNFRLALICDKNGHLFQKTSARMGTRLKNLLTDHRAHSGSKDCECCRSYNEEPRVEYRMITPHENQWITTGQITGGGHWLEDFARCHSKRSYLEEMDSVGSEDETWEADSVEEKTESYRDRRFCLGDFIVDKPLNMKEWVIVT